MKRIYFVRHGSTDNIEANAYQVAETPLSQKGLEQAESMAERLAKIPFDAVISSTMKRAEQTAEAIASKTGHTLILEPLFEELKRPSAVRGRVRTDPDVLEVMKAIDAGWGNSDTRHSDEENFYDLHMRAKTALEYLIKRPEDTLVVVTHAMFLKMLIMVMYLGGKATPELFTLLNRFIIPANTGITLCQYGNFFSDSQWELITWNDQAHLG